MNRIDITEEEFQQNFEFCIELCHRERIIWKVTLASGTEILCTPVVQSASPVPEHIVEQVEEFKREFLERTGVVSH
jgi:hypothetical protein